MIRKLLKKGLNIISKIRPRIRKVTPIIVTLPPNELLSGKTALITGGTNGIGFAIANAFLTAGANVIITSRNQQRATSTAQKLALKFPEKKIIGIALDNSLFGKDDTDSETLFAKIGNMQIDILVNNAGISGGDNNKSNLENFDDVFQTNLRGPFFLSKAIAEYMAIHHIEGNILNIASSSSTRPAITPYMMAKWGLRSMTLGLAKQYVDFGIVVNGIAPGPTATGMIQQVSKNNIVNKDNPIQRLILPEEIAQMAVILVSPLGRSIIGDIVYMTGGAGVITFDDVKYN